MVPTISNPIWVTNNGRITNVLIFTEVTEICEEACYFQKYVLSAGIGEISKAPPGSTIVVPVQGEMRYVRADLQEFINELFTIDEIVHIYVMDNRIVINPYILVTESMTNAVTEMVNDIWNLVFLDTEDFDGLEEAVNEGEWPELIG